MFKKLILIASVIGVGYFLYFGFQQMKIAQQPEVDLYSQLPSQTVLAMEITDLSSMWEDVASNNIIWEELQIFQQPRSLHSLVNKIDSSLISQSIFTLQKLPSILWSVTSEKDKKFETLIQFRKSRTIESDQYLTFIKSTFPSFKLTSSQNGLFQLKSENLMLYGLIKDDLISISTSEYSIQDILSPRFKSLSQNLDFQSVRKTSSKNAKSRIYLKPKEITKGMERYLNDRTQLEVSLFPRTSSWIEMDLDIKPDELSMGGFAIANDSLNHWFSIFENQEPMKPTVTEYLPNKTAFLLHFGFSDFSVLRSKMVDRNSKLEGRDYNTPIQTWDSIYEISIKNDFLNWIENELAISIIEPERSQVNSESLVWIQSSDARTMNANLRDFSLQVDNKEGHEFTPIAYKDYEINKLHLDGFLEVCLGHQFSLITENYFTRIEDFIIFSNSPATLQWCVDRYENERTLANDLAFQNFSNRISGSSNIFLYSNISKSPSIYKHLGSLQLNNEIENNLEFLDKFQGFSIQISHESDQLYYVNNYVRYNPVNKKMPNTLWETKLASHSILKPVILKNHYTNAKEIFIQDTSNTIYLVNNKGNVLWSKPLKEPIQSEVRQIDVYKNDKLQIIFNTANKVYILDRNGNDLSNFPIPLPSPASAPLLVVDYEHEKNYRFIVPTENGQILNYTTKGRLTKGWTYRNQKHAVTEEIKYINIKGKDYLIAIFQNGTIKGLNRKGDVRLSLKSKLNFPPLHGYSIQGGGNLASTYIVTMTSHQDVVKISLSDEKENMFSVHTDSIDFVNYANVDDDPHIEVITTGNNKVVAYTLDGQKIFNYSLRHEINFRPEVYRFSEEIYLGFVSTVNSGIYLIDRKGEPQNAFPLKGYTPFTITDINNDGRLNLISTDKEGVLLNYIIE